MKKQFESLYKQLGILRMYKIAIIGRPNVGKSTLFNKLVGKSFAMTDDYAGVTRDRKEAKAQIGHIKFTAIDTAGLENEIKGDAMTEKMVEQTYFAVSDADLCLFVVDGKNGIQNKDKYFSKWLHKIKKSVILVANKCESSSGFYQSWPNEFYALGFDEPVGISAEHKLGFGDLYDKILPFHQEYLKNFSDLEEPTDSSAPDLQVAIIGRPNAGKSTLLNRILSEERLVTGERAGITRDSIAVDHLYQDQKIRFIDTAGIRRKAHIKEKLEKMSASDSFRALRFAHIAVLMMDANSLVDHQDMALASEVLKEGRALIFVINKIDTVQGDKEKFLRQVRTQLNELFSEVDGAAILGISAQTGYNVDKLMSYLLKTYQQWQIRISTSKLNDWLQEATLRHPPKMQKGRETKVKYITQIKTRPPTFAVFTNHVKAIQSDYKRYLTNALRRDFDLGLSPVRMLIRKSDNPYAHLAKKKK